MQSAFWTGKEWDGISTSNEEAQSQNLTYRKNE